MTQTAHPPRYRPATREHLFVSEVYASFQGDGPHCGQPAVVLRLMGCNLTCTWCDARYTWDHRHYLLHEEGQRYTRQGVYDLVTAMAPRRLVITGGEPLLQSPALGPFVHQLAGEQPWHIEVETNGTLPPPSSWLFHVERWAVSPKLPHSGLAPERALNLPLLRTWASLRASFFKLVCKTAQDVEAAAKLAESCGLPPERVWIMPEGTTTPRHLHNLRRLADTTLAHGFNLAPRLTALLWNSERGR